jgi:large subunit ribosomal protein L33
VGAGAAAPGAGGAGRNELLRGLGQSLLSLALLNRGRPRPLAAMAKPKKKKEIVFLVCEETGDRNYTIFKKPGTNKLELMKYSPRVRKHTKHIEKKK